MDSEDKLTLERPFVSLPYVLGPFQDIWDAWDEVHNRLMVQPETHFTSTILTQLEEAEAEPRDTRAKEVIDIISVSLNWLRWLGYGPEMVAQAVQDRAAKRYVGQGEAIFEKYKGILDAEDIV